MVESYSDPTVEYSKLVNLLQSSNVSKGEVYSELMKKEENTLKTINRVVEHESNKRTDEKLLYNMPLLTIIALFVNTWRNIFLELASMGELKNFNTIYDIFTKKDRKIHVGLMLLVVGIFLYVIDIVE